MTASLREEGPRRAAKLLVGLEEFDELKVVLIDIVQDKI